MNTSTDRKLILHIGAHKTGSSAIQDFLKRHQSDLKNEGWIFGIRPEQPANWGDLVEVRPVPGGADFRLRPGVFKTLLGRIDGGFRHVIVSSEDLFFLEKTDIDGVAREMQSRFSEITVIAYVRRQDLMAQSHWAQGAKTIQSALVFADIDHPLPKISAHVRKYLDYAARLELWQAALPAAKMIVRVYDRELFPNRDVVADFIATTGLNLKSDDSNSDVNAAFGATTVRFIYMLRAAGVGQPQIRSMLRDRRLQVTEDKLLPTRAEAQAYVAEFAASNRRLGAMMGQDQPFSTDFSRYAETVSIAPVDPEYVRSSLLTLLVDAIKKLPPDA